MFSVQQTNIRTNGCTRIYNSLMTKNSLSDELKSTICLRPYDFSQFVNQNIIITGASGFVGKWLVGSWLAARELLGGSGELLLTCRNPRTLLDAFPILNHYRGVSLVASDIRRFQVMKEFHPDLMIHAATSASEELNRTNPMEMVDVIVSGTRRALYVAKMTSTRKFVYISSGAVYGNGVRRTLPFSEAEQSAPDCTNPAYAYHEAKRMAELIVSCESQRYNFGAVSLRLFAFLAPFLPLDTHFAAGNFVKQALEGKKIVIKSGGTSSRSYQYGSDLATNVVTIAMRENACNAYNVGSSTPITIKELAIAVKELVDSRIRVVVQGSDSDDTRTFYVPDTSRVRNEFELTDTVSLDESIARTVSWARLQKP